MVWFSPDYSSPAPAPPTPSVPRENLRLFCALRLVPLAGLCVGAYFLHRTEATQLHWSFIAALLTALALAIGLGWWRSFHHRAIGHGEFFGHLLVDIAIYSLLMYNIGGATNPFISYLLVPVTIAAIALPVALTWLTGIACLASYSLLLLWHVALPVVAPGGHAVGHAHQDSGINLHTLGMWLNFVVSALLIAYFVSRMARTIAAQEHSLARQHRKQLEDDQLLAVATVAASAAHELGTPLNTMKLLSDEWLTSGKARADDDFLDDLAIFNRQVERCQHTLKKLSGRAREYSGHGLVRQRVREYFGDLLDDWLVMRPDVKADLSLEGDDQVDISYHPSLSASIQNLLNNAGDASPGQVTIAVRWDRDQAVLEIRDTGQGFDAADGFNQPLASDKPAGMGLGLYLARTILARHGATIALSAAPGGGTVATIRLPLRQGNG